MPKVLHRDPEAYGSFYGQRSKIFRNPDPILHPFAREREYIRAVNACKIDRMFAKPLVAVLDGHTDAVSCMARGYCNLTRLFTGSCDGEVRFWNLSDKECTYAIKAHDGFVRGISATHDDRFVFSGGDDHIIKQWKVPDNTMTAPLPASAAEGDSSDAKIATTSGPSSPVPGDRGHLVLNSDHRTDALTKSIKPVGAFQSSSIVSSIDTHWTESRLVSCGESVDIWEYARSTPLHSFDCGDATLYSVKFNPGESHLVAACSSENSVILFDLRTASSIGKKKLKQKPNALSWNPRKPITFTVASDDTNLYSFDMRDLEQINRTHSDFTNSVLDVDYSPTGQEFVAGSFDHTIRIFPAQGQVRSREVYHTKRMQIVLATVFSGDGEYVLSGSSDTCIRVWKADASKRIGPMPITERRAVAYRKALIDRYKNVGDVAKIRRQRHLPSDVYNKTKMNRERTAHRQKKEEAKEARVKLQQERSLRRAEAKMNDPFS